MNSAAKTLGWNNGQTPNPNGSGGVVTTQGLDNRVGTGRMDLNRATTNCSAARPMCRARWLASRVWSIRLGWDFGQVAQNVPNDYLINSPLLVGSNVHGHARLVPRPHFAQRRDLDRHEFRQPRFGIVERRRGRADHARFHFQKPVQRQRTFFVRHSRDRAVHASRSLDRRMVRYGGRSEHRAIRPGLGQHDGERARAGDDRAIDRRNSVSNRPTIRTPVVPSPREFAV